MNKKEFIEKFASSESMRERNQKAKDMSSGLVKFNYISDIPSIDFCEVCLHPKGRTLNIHEMCTSTDDLDTQKIKKFKSRANTYFEGQIERGENCQQILNLVIPPDPKMIMELGNQLGELEDANIVITVYDPRTDRRGSCPINEEFLTSLREDPEYKGMDEAEIFANFLMNFVEML